MQRNTKQEGAKSAADTCDRKASDTKRQTTHQEKREHSKHKGRHHHRFFVSGHCLYMETQCWTLKLIPMPMQSGTWTYFPAMALAVDVAPNSSLELPRTLKTDEICQTEVCALTGDKGCCRVRFRANCRVAMATSSRSRHFAVDAVDNSPHTNCSCGT